LIALEYLAKQGWKVGACVVRPRAEVDPLLVRLRQSDGWVSQYGENNTSAWFSDFLENHSIVLDGILGTGLHLPLNEDMAAMLSKAKEAVLKYQDIVIVAVDCPSGVDCDSGEAAPETISASYTVCMAAVKEGLLKLPGFLLAGKIAVVDIGFPEDLTEYLRVKQQVVDEEMVRSILPLRPLDAHKGTFGTVLAAAGSVNYTGAALLAGKAAYRIGAGLVTMAIPTPLYTVIAGQFPEATWLLLPHEQGVIAEGAVDLVRKNANKATALLLGPGWGLEETTFRFLNRLLEGDAAKERRSIGFAPNISKTSPTAEPELPALVVDADALKLLARIPNWPDLLPKLSVLTPHPGEMSTICGLSKDQIQADRFAVALKFAHLWGHIVVLKGALTAVASPDGRLAVIPVASPALARAGTGDVLAGIIVGLRAQGVSAFEAAAAGAWIHAQAGLLAAQRIGTTASVVAGDILDAIGGIMHMVQPG
jgi:NAD(P)H-hydrate epimerase